jgi:tetratricopeptide (TPR) repeat protein
LGAEHIGPFVPDFGKIDQEKDHRLEVLAKTIAECTTIHSAATATMQLEPWDFMAVYYDSIDHFSHAFMRFHPPRLDWVPEDEFELFKGVVEGGYRYHDMMLGTLLALAGEETTVILVSDHGFHPDHLRPQHVPVEPAGPAVQHRNHGIFVMAGPGVKQDERIYGACLLDVTPTILRLFDLPVGEDMDGVPLVAGLADHAEEVPTIPSWDEVAGEDGAHPAGTTIDPVEAREAVNQLVALGYIEPPNENQEKAAAETVRELHYNVARSYMDAGRHLDAVPYLEDLFETCPSETRFGLHLVECLQSLDRLQRSRDVLDATMRARIEDAQKAQGELKQWQEEHKDQKPEDMSERERNQLRKLHGRSAANPMAFLMVQGTQLLAEGEPEKALVLFGKILTHAPQALSVALVAGQALNLLRRWREAEKQFRQVLKADPQNVRAHLGLCRAQLGQGHKRAAAESARKAVSLQHFTPVAHYLLGLAYLRQKRVPRAVEAFRTATRQNPNYPEAHRMLATIYGKYFHDPEKAAACQLEADGAKERIARLKSGEAKVEDTPSTRRRQVLSSDEDVLGVGTPISPPDGVSIEDTVIVVSGMPRSGTSMMMQMLVAGGLEACTDGKREADESNRRGYYEDERVKALGRDNSWLQEAKGKVVKIVAPLLSRLPRGPQHNYRIVFMERDLDEVVASQRAMLERLEQQGSKMPDKKLKAVFSEQLRRVKRLLAAAHQPTLFVQHRDCIERPAEVAERLRSFLGGQLDAAAATAVVEPSLYRQRGDES